MPKATKTILIAFPWLWLGCQAIAIAENQQQASSASLLLGPNAEQACLAKDKASKVLLASSAQGASGAASAAQEAAAQTAKSSAAATQAPTPADTSTAPKTEPFTAIPQLEPPNFSPQPAGSSLQTPASAGTKPVLRENIVHNNAARETQDNSVQSFFDCEPVPPLSTHSASQVVPPTAGESLGWRHSASRALWHILDNAGVPMFFGNHEADLDPSIGQRAYINPPERLPTETLGEKIRRKSTKTVVEIEKKPRFDSSLVSTPANPQAVLHKIPQSELEGTIDEPQGATQTRTPPVTPDGHEQAQ